MGDLDDGQDLVRLEQVLMVKIQNFEDRARPDEVVSLRQAQDRLAEVRAALLERGRPAVERLPYRDQDDQ